MSESQPCGSCTVCCHDLAVEELSKPSRTPCRHLCSTGCGIYRDETKPKICADYECVWKQFDFSREFRPDKCGILFEFQSDWGGEDFIHIRAREVRKNAIKKPKGISALQAMIKTQLVIVKCRYEQPETSSGFIFPREMTEDQAQIVQRIVSKMSDKGLIKKLHQIDL